MFERFTEGARRVIVLAQEEARMLGHNYIGTEHILLGLIDEGEGVAARALESLGIGLDAVRQAVEGIIGRGHQAPSGLIPFTPRAKKVLELALRETLQLGRGYIGTEHILLALIREGDGVAAQILTRAGVGLERARQEVIEMRPGQSEQDAPSFSASAFPAPAFPAPAFPAPAFPAPAFPAAAFSAYASSASAFSAAAFSAYAAPAGYDLVNRLTSFAARLSVIERRLSQSG